MWEIALPTPVRIDAPVYSTEEMSMVGCTYP